MKTVKNNPLTSIFLLIVSFFVLTGCPPNDSEVFFELTLSSNPAEGGTVKQIPGDTGDGVFTIGKGYEFQLEAIANENWVFAGWEGDVNGIQNPIDITMDASMMISARFEPQEYPLTVNIEGEGAVTETIAQSKLTDYEFGTNIQIEAFADQGWTFREWTGDIQSTDNPETVTVDGPKNVTAVFEQSEFTVQVSAEGPGTVSVDPEKETYQLNESVQFSAMPNSGNQFLGWFNEDGTFEMLQADFEYQITEDLDISAFFNSVEGAFVIQTADIIVVDDIVDTVVFNIFNFLLGDVTLNGAEVSDEEGESVGTLGFENPPVLSRRTGIEVTVQFGEEEIDGEIVKDWVFNWLFNFDGNSYEKEQEVGEPEMAAKQALMSHNDVEIRKSIRIYIK